MDMCCPSIYISLMRYCLYCLSLACRCRRASDGPCRSWWLCDWTGSCKVEWSITLQILNPASPVVPVTRQLVPSVWAMAVIKKDFPVPAVSFPVGVALLSGETDCGGRVSYAVRCCMLSRCRSTGCM